MRYALGVEYDGGPFQGWQGLGPSGPPTVQAALERALSSVADQAINVSCAGRTDAGVHAQCQVVHFDSTATRDPRAWTLGVTGRLPASVCVRWCVPVDAGFHAMGVPLEEYHRIVQDAAAQALRQRLGHADALAVAAERVRMHARGLATARCVLVHCVHVLRVPVPPRSERAASCAIDVPIRPAERMVALPLQRAHAA